MGVGVNSGTTLGAAMLTVAMVFFAAEMVAVRFLSDDVPLVQIVLFRLGFQALVLLPVVLWHRGAPLRTARLPLHGARAAFSALGMALFYLAYILLPLALATTVTFMNAIFVVVLAALVLRERIGPYRIGAVAMGFAGVLVAMRPGVAGVDIGMLVGLAGSFAAACLIIITRALTASESRLTVMSYSAGFGLLFLTMPAVLAWQPLELRHLSLLGLVGLTGTAGQFLMVGAFQIAEASALAPVDFLRLIFAVVAGYIFFGEVPDLWTWAGAMIIITAVAFATHRERLAAARSAAPNGRHP